MSFLGRLKEGLLDPIYGASQLLENSVESLSPATADIMGKADNWLFDKTGGLLGLPEGTDVDQQLVDREKNYEDKYNLQGETDWPRMIGNVGTAVALAPTIPAGAGLMKTAGLLGAEGAAFGAAMPQTEEGKSYGDQIMDDALLGGALGAGIGAPLAKVAKAIKSAPTREILETPAEKAARELPYYKAMQDVPEGVRLSPKDMEFIRRQVGEVYPSATNDILSEAYVPNPANYGNRNAMEIFPDSDARSLMSEFDNSITGFADDEASLLGKMKQGNESYGNGKMPMEMEHELSTLLEATDLQRSRVGGMRDYARDLIKEASPEYAEALSKAKVPYRPKFEEESLTKKLSPYIARAAGDGGLLGVMGANYNSR